MQNKENANEKKFLDKDEELALGRLIQAHFRALEELESGKRLSQKKREALEADVAVGKAAVDKLVNANVGLVYDRARIFKSRYPSGPELEDLVQEGMLGLMAAVKKYDPTRQNKFSTVAYYWIAQAVARGANKTGRLVRLPENRINDFSAMTALMNSEEAQGLSSSELDELIMERVGVSKPDLLNIRSAAATPASLNKVVGSDNGSTKELMDFVSDNSASASSEEEVLQATMTQELLQAVYSLEPMKKDVVLASFSLTDGEGCLSADEVRDKYDLPSFKFKRVQAEAVRELNEILTARGFSFADFAANA